MRGLYFFLSNLSNIFKIKELNQTKQLSKKSKTKKTPFCLALSGNCDKLIARVFLATVLAVLLVLLIDPNKQCVWVISDLTKCVCLYMNMKR